jgi:hypothetical protein
MRVLLLESVHEEAQALLDAAVEVKRATALDGDTVAREAASSLVPVPRTTRSPRASKTSSRACLATELY